MKEKMDERRKVIGIAMAAMIVASILAVIAPQAFGYFRPVPIPPGEEAIYYLSPRDSSVPEGYCNSTEVELHVNSSLSLCFGKVSILYDHLCVNITRVTFNTTVWDDPIGTGYSIPYPGKLVITYSKLTGEYPPGDYPICNITIHCNSTECCKTDLNFVPETYITNMTLGDLDVPGENGTFTCGKPSIMVNKKVYDPATGTWVDSLDTAEKGKEYMFRINVTASPCADLTNLVVNDTLSGVIVANCTSVSPPPVSCLDTFIQWTFPTLNASETKTLYFNATVTDYGMGVDKASATAYS
ncbi:MAG: hypothetical protein DRN20_06500, partial [Thermoplasmata archaeon]